MLLDIVVPHVYKGNKSIKPLPFLLHPFTQTVGEWKDHYEVIFTRVENGKSLKKSGHVTKLELAEMFARSIFESHRIRIRLRPAADDYPDSAPGKMVSASCIQRGSDFESLVSRIDTEKEMSEGLRKQLVFMKILK